MSGPGFPGYCKSLAETQDGFHINVKAARLSNVFVVLTGIIYIVNSGTILNHIIRHRKEPRRTKDDRVIWHPESMSILLASIVGLVLIWATWPQPFEAGALLVVVLAQVTALGWQDHDPDVKSLKTQRDSPYFRDLLVAESERALDLLGLIVATYALHDAGQKVTHGGRYPLSARDNPTKLSVLVWALAGTGTGISVIQDMLLAWLPSWQQLILGGCSCFFMTAQFATATVATSYGSRTLPTGCPVFNAPKVCCIVIFWLGFAYSLLISVMRFVVPPPGKETGNATENQSNQTKICNRANAGDQTDGKNQGSDIEKQDGK